MSDVVRQIADAVLYEGYMLWPYRRSSTKNQRRWTFGGVYPEAHARAAPDDPGEMQTQCLLELAGPSSVDVEVRFLHVVERRVFRSSPAGREPVDELVVGGERYLSWEEAAERTASCTLDMPAAGTATARVPIAIAAGADEEPLPGGALVRSWHGLDGAVELAAETLAPDLVRLTVRIANVTPWPGGDRELALRRTFVSTHTILHATGAAFVSATDPPEALRDLAATCRNVGTWPVLVGAAGERGIMLSSPIILCDYPEIAPESPGDMFDATEIDGLLTLSILSLTEEEQREMRDSDPRARRILERTAALSEEELMRMHGAVRELRMLPGP